MEKEHQPDSMATITMKADYPPSEVYSTSEPPPAYRQQASSSVQIARIVALTVVASSFILGSFILASSWVQARASCHQLEQLDAMLDKELALEGRSYNNDALYNDEPLPVGNAHALHGAPPMPSASVEVPTQAPTQAAPAPPNQMKDDGLNLAESKIDEDKLQKIDESSKGDKTESDESSDSDSSEDEDDLEALRPMFKLPVQFDLDELAGAFLANSQKGRMNCMVERRNEEPMERRFPFNILAAFAPPRPQQGERIAIICHGGDEQRPMIPEPQSQVFAFPLSGPVRLPIRPEHDGPAAAPEDRMPPPPFAPFAPHRSPPFRMPMPWESSEEEQQNSGPREMRIHVQRVIAIPSGHSMQQVPEGMGPFAPPSMPQNHNDQIEQQGGVVHQYIPQPAPTQELDQQPEMQKMNGQMPMEMQWGGLTPEDIQMIQRTAEDAMSNQRRDQQMDNDMQEFDLGQVKNIVRSLAAAEEEAVAAAEAEEQRRQEARPQQVLDAPAQGPRAPRTLLLPQEMTIDERPHYVQPRSVRSVDALLHREKRVKRCACNCA